MSNRRGSVDYPLRGTGRARNVHVSRRGSVDLEFGRAETSKDMGGRRESVDYPVRLESGKKMNMHVNRRGSVDVEFQRSRGEDEETSREFATRFSDIRGGEDEEDTIKRVQSALLARRVVAKEQDDTVLPPSSNGSATIRRGYNTVEVLTGRSAWWRS